MRREAQKRLDKKKNLEESPSKESEEDQKPAKPASKTIGYFYFILGITIFIGFITAGQVLYGVLVSSVMFFLGYRQILDANR